MAQDYKFMQICGNCAFVLMIPKENRVSGPVDNVDCKGIHTTKALVQKTYVERLLSESPKCTPREARFEGDSNMAYQFKFADILHNNVNDLNYIKHVAERQLRFNKFYNDIKKDSNKYFIVCLSRYLVYRESKLLKTDEQGNVRLVELIKYLSKLKILDKTIFVQLKHENPDSVWNYYSPEFPAIAEKYKLKTITIHNVRSWGEREEGKDNEKCKKEFTEEITKLLASEK